MKKAIVSKNYLLTDCYAAVYSLFLPANVTQDRFIKLW